MMNTRKAFILAFYILFSSSVLAADDFTKAIMLNTVDITSKKLTNARMSELSPAAIEKGLKDAQLLGEPKFDKKSKVLSVYWHSITKTMNGTEHSKSLTTPLVTQVKLGGGSTTLNVGQEITLKGDLDGMLEDFDALLVKAKESENVSNNNEETTNNTVGEESSDSNSGGSSGSDSSTSGGEGYLSEGGLSENPTGDEIDIETDKITTTIETCSNNVDWASSNVFKQERKVKNSESGEINEVGDCYNVGQAYRIEKDYAASCNVQINGLTDYIRGFIYYAFMSGEKLILSECKYDSDEKETLLIKHDFDVCSLDTSQTNLADNTYNLAAVSYALINTKRYNLTECEIVNSAVKPLPTKIESCPIKNDIATLTSYTMERTDIYDPSNNTRLKTGDCVEAKSFPIEQDFNATCTLKFKANGDYVRGYKLFSNVENVKQDLTECLYSDDNLEVTTLLRDFDACSLNTATVNTLTGTYYPSFVNYVLVDGQRYDQSACITATDHSKPLPTKIETCPIVHDNQLLQSQTMQRTDVYDPSNTEVLTTGECAPLKTYSYLKDSNANCAIQINGDSFLRGYTYYSTIDGKRYDLSECQYDKGDTETTTLIKDYDVCSVDKGTVDVNTGVYFPAFVNYVSIDGQRHDQSECITDPTDNRILPTRLETCSVVHDQAKSQSFTMERTDTYDPTNKELLKTGECSQVAAFNYQKDFNAGCTVKITDDSFVRGFKYYSLINGERYSVSECQYNDEDLETTKIIKDYDACSIDNGTINANTGLYYPAFINYMLIDGKRYDQSGCVTALDDNEQLPTRIASCDIIHDQDKLQSVTMSRVDVYDPTDKQLLKTGECAPLKTYSYLKDSNADCAIKINGSSFLRGYTYYSSVEGQRYDVSECQYDNADTETTQIIKDYDVCSVDKGTVDVNTGVYFPAFVNYVSIDGQRYDQGGCITEPTDNRILPTRLETCSIVHDQAKSQSFTMERTDTYDPTNKELLKTGECSQVDSFDFQKDFNAGCDIKVTASTFLRGYKYYSFIGSERYDVSACKYDVDDTENTDVLNDFDACSIDVAKINLDQGNYEPAFKQYTLIDGQRY